MYLGTTPDSDPIALGADDPGIVRRRVRVRAVAKPENLQTSNCSIYSFVIDFKPFLKMISCGKNGAKLLVDTSINTSSKGLCTFLA